MSEILDISVVIQARNGEAKLPCCLELVVSQTPPPANGRLQLTTQ